MAALGRNSTAGQKQSAQGRQHGGCHGGVSGAHDDDSGSSTLQEAHRTPLLTSHPGSLPASVADAAAVPAVQQQ